MFEKVNPSHPDKVADRIAGAIVDMAYKMAENPKIAVEVLIGHGDCKIIIEGNTIPDKEDMVAAVYRIAEDDSIKVNFTIVPQDPELAKNQKGKIRCGDNGIFKGSPVSAEEMVLTDLAHNLYNAYHSDGKYIYDEAKKKCIICQSKMTKEDGNSFEWVVPTVINPLGPWTGGINTDSGATNRKLGSDMGRGVTGGGLHGKDLSKADVSVNIYAHLAAQAAHQPVEMWCAIGDESVNGIPYSVIVETAREYIKTIGGFEKFAEWGLIR